MPLRLPALAVLLALVACQPEDAALATAPDRPDASRGEALPDTATVQAVAPGTTADLVGQRLDAVSPSIAIQTIDRWTERIDSLSAEGERGEALSQLSADLTTLRLLLQSSPLDGPAIGRTLRALSETTVSLAEPGSEVERLARVLATQADRLAPEPSESGFVDSSGSPSEGP